MAGLGESYLGAIRRFEGFNPRPYWDVRQWTSGYGTRAGGPGEVIDRQEAERRLNAELGNAQGHVRGLGVSMTPGQEAALTSLTFNAGPSWMNSGLGQAVRAGDWGTARQRFLQYVNAGGQPLPGLRSRRAEEASWLDQPAQAAPPPTGGIPMATAAGPGLSQGWLDWLIPQAEARSGTFAPRRPLPETFGGDWSVGGAMPGDTPSPAAPSMPFLPPNAATTGPRTRTGAAYRSLLPPTGSARSGWRPPGASRLGAAPFGVPDAFGGDWSIGQQEPPSTPSALDIGWQPPQPEVPPFPEGTVTPTPQPTAPPQRGFFDRLEGGLTSPLAAAGLSLLFPQSNLSGAMQGAMRAQREQDAYQRQQGQRSVMDRIWAEAFPGGQPNMQHPLLAGQSPQVAAMIAGLGPDAALPLLAQTAMKGGQWELKDAAGQPVLFNPRGPNGAPQIVPIPGMQGGKPPAGYRWAEGRPGQLEPIPGGPGEHIAAEVAGRLAIMRTAKPGLPAAREFFTRRWGAGESARNAIGGAVVAPEYDRHRRTVRLAVEGSLRAMTGAAAPQQEVDQYMEMFMPRVTDPPQIARQKLDMLEQFMSNAEEIVTRGRRAAGSEAQPQGGGDGFSIRRLQ